MPRPLDMGGLFASTADVQQLMWYQFWIKGILLYSMFLWN